jgi:hypothetical protein
VDGPGRPEPRHDVNWNTNAFKQVNLETLFQDSFYVPFDPRVIHDPYWDRFVVLADACNPCSGSGTRSLFSLAISQTNDPTGSWWIFGLGLNTNLGDFADFPQLGMDLNSLIVTFNVFTANNTFDARTLSFSKAYPYNGSGFNYRIFGGSSCTVAPPYVLDDSGVDYLLSFCPGDSKVSIMSLTNAGLSNVSLHLDNTVTVENSASRRRRSSQGPATPSTPATTGSRTAHCRSAAGS